MEYTKESGLVRVWVQLIQSGAYCLDDVPALGNLPKVVAEVLKG